MGYEEPMLGDVRFTMFAWEFDTFLLGDEFFEWCAWGCGFQGLVCLGTSILAPLLLGVRKIFEIRGMGYEIFQKI